MKVLKNKIQVVSPWLAATLVFTRQKKRKAEYFSADALPKMLFGITRKKFS
ncbi:MAG: hypothetical protein H5U29_09425 [Pusillimonas sp.]|nr:hypothetical protein [Pusillimonas sp.]